jgi:hypothetical protein
LEFREALVECPSLDFQVGIFTGRTISNSLLELLNEREEEHFEVLEGHFLHHIESVGTLAQ